MTKEREALVEQAARESLALLHLGAGYAIRAQDVIDGRLVPSDKFAIRAMIAFADHRLEVAANIATREAEVCRQAGDTTGAETAETIARGIREMGGE